MKMHSLGSKFRKLIYCELYYNAYTWPILNIRVLLELKIIIIIILVKGKPEMAQTRDPLLCDLTKKNLPPTKSIQGGGHLKDGSLYLFFFSKITMHSEFESKKREYLAPNALLYFKFDIKKITKQCSSIRFLIFEIKVRSNMSYAIIFPGSIFNKMIQSSQNTPKFCYFSFHMHSVNQWKLISNK